MNKQNVDTPHHKKNTTLIESERKDKTMRKLSILLTLFILVTAIALSQTVAGRYKIEMNDPIGDVQENDGKPGKDVVKISITSDGEKLQIITELKENVSYYLKDQLAGPVIEIHFNTDNNDATGGIAFWGKNKKGFEFQMNLVSCIKYKGGLACLGALEGKIEGFVSSYSIYKYEQDKKMPKSINNAIESTQKEITGKTVEITLPYSEIGIKSGSRIRMFIRESDSTFDDSSYFPQVFLIIK